MRKSVDHVNQKPITSTRPGDAADEVFEAVHAVMHAFRGRQYRAVHNAAHDLTHLDGKVLGFFAHHPGATQSDLATHSGRDKGQLARLIGGLKERGLLEAQPDAADRRNLRLSLTAAGQAVQQELRRHGRRLSNAALTGLSDDERQQLLALLQRVRANLDDAA